MGWALATQPRSATGHLHRWPMVCCFAGDPAEHALRLVSGLLCRLHYIIGHIKIMVSSDFGEQGPLNGTAAA